MGKAPAIAKGARRAAWGLSLMLLPLLASCATRPGQGTALPPPAMDTASPEVLPPAPLPHHGVGDSFTFDNPEESWTVSAIDEKGRLKWQSSQGAERLSSANPLLPSLFHRSADGRSITRVIDNGDGLFPLKRGVSSGFTEAAGLDEPPYSRSFMWSCTVPAEERITVPAGTFDTFRVVCDRDDRLRVVSSYAPTVGYVVRRDLRLEGQPTETRSLVAYVASSLPAPPASSATRRASQSQGLNGIEAMPLSPPPAPPPQPQPQPQPPTVIIGQMTTGPDSSPRYAPETAAEEPYETVVISSATHPGPPPSGGVLLQVAAYRSQAQARHGWDKMRADHGPLIGDLTPVIRQIEIPGKGTYYRLFAGPLDPGRAQSLCRTLPELAGHCATSPAE
ncbi:SPOR domain-containing protein [Rhodospirillum rubrum]|uniref:SPOR domain-containing protein n=1 Tax=Rhodospirillum rubrum TaxID=1085 RepID=UPI0019061901|nr:SPOR domain-containing protein [Rhodospirillum rubrum]MBK1663538.1 SPOR domain-containing protein [Rhodospirillum rubrum]MBK1675661.1 SPOR domain-containing protein [Rhodospirillum rubrum]